MAALDARAATPSLDDDQGRRSRAISAAAPATRRSTARFRRRGEARDEDRDASGLEHATRARRSTRRSRSCATSRACRSPARPTSTSALNFGTLARDAVPRHLGAATSCAAIAVRDGVARRSVRSRPTRTSCGRRSSGAPADAGRRRRASSAACRSRTAARSAATSRTARRPATRCRCSRRRMRSSCCAASRGERRVPFTEFYTGYRTTVLRAGRADRRGRDSARRRASSGSGRSARAPRRRSRRSSSPRVRGAGAAHRDRQRGGDGRCACRDRARARRRRDIDDAVSGARARDHADRRHPLDGGLPAAVAANLLRGSGRRRPSAPPAVPRDGRRALRGAGARGLRRAVRPGRGAARDRRRARRCRAPRRCGGRRRRSACRATRSATRRRRARSRRRSRSDTATPRTRCSAPPSPARGSGRASCAGSYRTRDLGGRSADASVPCNAARTRSSASCRRGSTTSRSCCAAGRARDVDARGRRDPQRARRHARRRASRDRPRPRRPHRARLGMGRRAAATSSTAATT